MTPAELVRELIRARHVPGATYRVQLNKDFPFARAVALVGYWRDLGITDLYVSPILQARPGSAHGYDTSDHGRVSADLGGEEGLEALSRALQEAGIGLLVDAVSNHMGIGDSSNRWWMDVLENGASSRYAIVFDIDWHPTNPDLANKVLLPVLGEQYGQVLESGQLRVQYEEGAFFLTYFDKRFPLAPDTYGALLRAKLDELDEQLGSTHEHVQELHSIVSAVTHLPPRVGATPEQMIERDREKEVVKRRLAAVVHASPEVRAAIESSVALFNGTPDVPASFDPLADLIEAQSYRLANWRVASEEINYRRFFDINDLVAIRPELPEVFEGTHRVFLRLLGEGKITGLRIDHPDGLWAPAAYFRQLQESYLVEQMRRRGIGAGSPEEEARDAAVALTEVAALPQPTAWPFYVVAEKILTEGEPLPVPWAVAGTTGYDFLNAVNGLFVEPANGHEMDRIYREFTGEESSLAELVLASKTLIMEGPMASEINSLSYQLDRIAERNRRYRDFTLGNLSAAVRAIIANLPIYRTYLMPGQPVTARDRVFIEETVERAKGRTPRMAEAVFDFIRDTLLWHNLEQFREADRPKVVEWVMRFQQLTGPIMAKGVEDTAFYVFNRLVSLNEVGGHPEQFGLSVEAFHAHNADVAARWPHGLLATSTHDTKRSEDVRARIDVLSEVPSEWERAVRRWRELHAPLVRNEDGGPAPSANDQYLFYQTVVGAWPAGELTPEAFSSFRARIADYMLKAIKEAKVRTSWVNPEDAYDAAVRAFVMGALSDDPNDPFRREAEALVRRVGHFGHLNSLVQVVLKATSPGVPDFYQGSELWDFSLVDPDNRRPVDYDARKWLLGEMRAEVGREGADLRKLVGGMLDTIADGRIKLYLTFQSLDARRRLAAVFREGNYVPLPASGSKAEHVVAFARAAQEKQVLTIAGVRLVGLTVGQERRPVGESIWGDTRVQVPEEKVGARYRDVFTGAMHTVDEAGGLWAREVLSTLPVALLERVEEGTR
jgi:(1->4)-alpha-D-glucan 1-alpha-D-glucosylmutase